MERENIMMLDIIRERMKRMEWRNTKVEETLKKVECCCPKINASLPADISFADSLGIPVHITTRTTAMNVVNFGDLKEWGNLELSYTHKGKGLTEEQSRLSCIMEAIERYSASYLSASGRLKIATYDELGGQAIDPRDYYLPPGVIFSPDKELMWYEGNDLITNQKIYVPIDFVLLDIPDSAFPFKGFDTKRLGFYFSNGLGAGTTLDEAVMSGICEVVERDAGYRIAKEMGPMPTELVLERDESFDPWIELFKQNKLTLRAFYTCNVKGFYSTVAASWDHYCQTLVLGTASDPDIGISVFRAIMELIQQRSFMFFNTWKTRREYFPIVRYLKERIPPEMYGTSVPETFWTERCPEKVLIKDVQGNNKRDVESLIKNLSSYGRVIALDLTHPDIGIPVVRVIISRMGNDHLDYRPALAFVKEHEKEAKL